MKNKLWFPVLFVFLVWLSCEPPVQSIGHIAHSIDSLPFPVLRLCVAVPVLS
jgi:hypothetical protein